MLEFLNPTAEDDAIAILKGDHDKVKDIFSRFEKAESLSEKKKLAAQAIMELRIHATIEEEIFYPTVRPQVGKDLMNEADEEHHVAKLLIAELDAMSATEDHWEAKFTVLSENIRHHIREEEGEMFPKVRSANLDMSVIGRKLLTRKQDLKKNGIPPSAEDKLMKRGGVRADSPAQNARKKSPMKAKAKAKSPMKKLAKLITSAKKRLPAPRAKANAKTAKRKAG